MSSDSSLAPSLSVTHYSPSDHFPIFTKLSVDHTPLPPPRFHSFRHLHSTDINSFLAHLYSTVLSAYSNPSKSLGSLLSAYNITQTSLLDKHAPVTTSNTTHKAACWYFLYLVVQNGFFTVQGSVIWKTMIVPVL